MKTIKIYLIIFILPLMLTSCKAWLTVDSEDRIMEDALYQKEEGFFTALNGVYAELPRAELYGKSLLSTVFDVQAQYYNTTLLSNHTYRTLAEYNPEARKNAVKGIWEKCYFLIANINVILYHCEHNRNVLSNKAYDIVKGEALALRAMLHFEVFRIFGPIYSEAPGAESIPYHTGTELSPKKLLPANEVVGLIATDLVDAIDLLSISDPVITDGKLNSEVHNVSNKYRFRNYRLNYFAAKALMARFLMYTGDTSEALRYATEVISEASGFFPFATREQVTGQAAVGSVSANSEDRVFSSEILFGVQNIKRTADIYDKFFSNKLENKDVLVVGDQAIGNLYDTEGDLRLYQWQSLKSVEGIDNRFFVKYAQVQDMDHGYGSVIPLLRMSEMYLIAAECQTVDSDAYNYINIVRGARKATTLTNTNFRSRDLTLEYIREFVGEGQLFWFYKRTNESLIRLVYSKDNAYMPMSSTNYLFPLPEAEQGHH